MSMREVNGNREYVEKLIAALEHPEPGTRIHTAWILGELRSLAAVDSLLGVLETCRDDPELLAAVAEALGKIGADSAIRPLIRLSERSFLKARLAAISALTGWSQRDEVKRALARALLDSSALVRAAAAKALAESEQSVP